MAKKQENAVKKICITTTVPNTIKAFALETAKCLHSELGCDITFICNYDEEFEKSLPEYFHYIPIHMSRGIDFSGFASVFKYYRVFRKEKFDLVQYSTPNASCYASIAAFMARVPKRVYAQWGIRYVGLSGMSRRIFKFIEKMVCTLSTHVRAVSHLNREFAINEKLYKAKKAKVVGNGGTIGVDLNDFDISNKEEWRSAIREKLGVGKDDFVFGFAGRVSADKGCKELFAAYKKAYGDLNGAKMLVLGRVEENNGIDKELFEWAKNCESIIMPGRIDKSEMKKYYSAMDVLVHPTYREGFGMVIQEAGALALPVITTKIPGASEVMEDGKSCYLVEPKNADELCEMMIRCVKDKESFAAIGKAAYERTVALYARPIMLKNQKEDYEQLLNERR